MASSRGSSYRFDPRQRRSPHALERSSAEREERPLLVLAAEGETEENYLDEIVRAERDAVAVRFILAERRGTDPRTIVEAAIVAKDGYGKRWRAGSDRAYAVFDGDEHNEGDPGKRERVAQALDMARANSIYVARSNPSTEFWILLHHYYTSAPMHRDVALKEVERLIPGYVKGTPIYRVHLQSRTQAAMRHAAQLRRHHEGAGSGTHPNPSTDMDTLLHFLFGGRVPGT